MTSIVSWAWSSGPTTTFPSPVLHGSSWRDCGPFCVAQSGGDSLGTSGPLCVGQLTLWPEKRYAEWGGRAIELTSTEFNLLLLLVHNAGRIVTKAELSEQGLGRPLARFDRSIDVHVSSLRQKVGKLADGRSCIQTVRGQGYQFVKE